MKISYIFLSDENIMKVTDKLSQDDMFLRLSAERYILSLIFNIVCMDHQAHTFLGTINRIKNTFSQLLQIIYPNSSKIVFECIK